MNGKSLSVLLALVCCLFAATCALAANSYLECHKLEAKSEEQLGACDDCCAEHALLMLKRNSQLEGKCRCLAYHQPLPTRR